MSSDEVNPPKKAKNIAERAPLLDQRASESSSSVNILISKPTHFPVPCIIQTKLEAGNNELTNNFDPISDKSQHQIPFEMENNSQDDSDTTNQEFSTPVTKGTPSENSLRCPLNIATKSAPCSLRTSKQNSHFCLFDDHKWVDLNVGGTVLTTTKTTLLKYSEESQHFLAMLVSDPPEHLPSRKDSNGAYLIDRNPEYFKQVINYLRNGRLDVPDNHVLEAVLSEAEFCNLPSLIRLCSRRIEERDAEQAKQARLLQRDTQKRVIYRVLQSSAQELTQMISTLSESWRLEQIMTLESNDPAHHTNGISGNEYLVVVSQEQNEEDHNGTSRGSRVNGSFSNCNDKVKALSGSLSAHTITNLYR